MPRPTAIAIALLTVAAHARAQDAVPETQAPARWKVLTRGLDQPVALTYAPGDPVKGRLFVVEKSGRVRALVNGRPEERPLVDVSARISTWTEQGLLGLAFHPKWAANGRLFVTFTDKKGDTRVVEFGVPKGTPGRVDPASEHEWLKVEQPYKNHNGGDLVFGPDGKLYIGLGDGGAHDDPHGNGQSPTARLGKMLRLDVDRPGAQAEIVYKGLRNPWRYAFDRKTGDLYIADVGQDHWEEIDVLPATEALKAGANFGWKLMEGNHCRPPTTTCDKAGLLPPVAEYSHRVGCSVTGGFVYRGKAIPQLDGVYLYSDYCTAILRGFKWQNGKVTDHFDYKRALDPEYQLAQVSSFGEDADGELYLLSLEGTLWKLSPK